MIMAHYMQRLQRVLGDQTFQRFNPYDLMAYINEARSYVAAQSECVRVLCPSVAGVSSVAVTSGGAGYTTPPAVTFSPPTLGTVPTAYANVAGGAVFSITVLTPGDGYTYPPIITLTGGGGTGAVAAATLLPFAQCTAGQEVYRFTDFNPLILGSSAITGAAQILSINSIAVSWGSMKPTLRYRAWGEFQAYYRAYNVAAQGYPRIWSQFQRGTLGSFYLWPVPSQSAQMDLDCVCLPADLGFETNDDVDAIPYPWTNAVSYKAAEIAVLGEPDLSQMADRFTAHFDRRMEFAAVTASAQSRVPDFYA
jgi:hypothetical protein